ncbi:MAG: HD domain-containing protein [Lachnospiraceae bacterium]|nr:HD domain-containing protein [Lachnospiraceae bacterium]
MLFYKYSKARKRSVEIIEMLIGVIEAGDSNLDGHSLHVHNLTMLIYDYLPFRYRRKLNPTDLEYASLLLDIGKLGVSRRILNKSGKLVDDEWALMKRHPEIGVKILGSVDYFDRISDWILYHHERVDGSGYYKLKGDQIPLASRVMAVADTYSAITMERSYKPSHSYEEAVSELRLVSGTQLDEELVEIFCNIPINRIASCMEDVKKRMQRFTEERFREE